MALFNVQSFIENPFDQKGLDDIKLNEFEIEQVRIGGAIIFSKFSEFRPILRNNYPKCETSPLLITAQSSSNCTI